ALEASLRFPAAIAAPRCLPKPRHPRRQSRGKRRSQGSGRGAKGRKRRERRRGFQDVVMAYLYQKGVFRIPPLGLAAGGGGAFSVVIPQAAVRPRRVPPKNQE